jgi:bifunctional DNA-binding transcriptional regulator/antitoxin component of YhaV-PrlF toxin-antitoxin module
VTIPVEVRKHLKLKPGDKIDFQIEENGTARIFPFSRKVSDVYGLLARKDRELLSVEEIDDRLKEKFREGAV